MEKKSKRRPRFYRDRLKEKLKDPNFKKEYEKNLKRVNKLLGKAEKKGR